jgi:hypothetical protein
MSRAATFIFLAPADGAAVPSIATAAIRDALAGRALARREPQAEKLGSLTADPGALDKQGWGIIVRKSAAGEYRQQLARLIEARERQQRAAVRIYEIDSDLDGDDALDWCKKVYLDDQELEKNRPRYLLILGHPAEVSFALQQALGVLARVGRLAFDDPAHYQAYADKVLRWEAAARTRPDVMFASLRDGTEATEAGWSQLMQPCHQRCVTYQPMDEPAAAAIEQLGERKEVPVDVAGLIARAGKTPSSVMMTMSHGLGPPRAGWSEADRHDKQGALRAAAGVLDGKIIAGAPFLPGGAWICFACFGAGTPSRSAYESLLQSLGEHEAARRALAALAPTAFVAALPKAALANPAGPLAVIGHVDLAWSYSFYDVDDQRRITRFHEMINSLCRGSRVGLALAELTRAAQAADFELAEMSQKKADAIDDQLRAARTMQRNDLHGYVLLGDPAAALAVSG